MNLTLFEPEAQHNLLPFDGAVQDYGCILTLQQSQQYLDYFLQHLAWQHDNVFLFGKQHMTSRKIAWYGDANYRYEYSGSLKQAQAWQPALLRLKNHIEQVVGHTFNSCLANLYADGSQGMGWHSDDEPTLGTHSVIASLSFGATRKFSFKHKRSADKVDLMLHSGQLIVMRAETQLHWKHTLMKSTQVHEPRINLTFRNFLA